MQNIVKRYGLQVLVAFVSGAFAIRHGSWVDSGDWGLNIDYGRALLITMPIAILNGFIARRVFLVAPAALGLCLVGILAVILSHGRYISDAYSGYYPAYPVVWLHGISNRLILFFVLILPVFWLISFLSGIAVARWNGSSSRTDVFVTLAIWLSGLAPLLFFIDFNPPDCDMGGRMLHYDTVLGGITLTATVIAFAQGAIVPAMVRIQTVSLAWFLIACSLIWFSFTYDYRFFLTDTYLRRDEFFIGMYWKSLLYMCSILPLLGPLVAYWGRRWRRDSLRIVHLMPPLILAAIVFCIFAYLQHL